VRKLLRHLPQEFTAKSTWRYVEAQLNEAALGADTADVAVVLRLVLSLGACRAAQSNAPAAFRRPRRSKHADIVRDSTRRALAMSISGTSRGKRSCIRPFIAISD